MTIRSAGIGRTLRSAGFLLASLFPCVPALGFQSVKIESVFCGTVTGGTAPPSELLIRHVPLIQGSAVTKEVVINGEVGTEFPPTSPSYEQRETPFSDDIEPQDITLRIRVEYESLPSVNGEISAQAEATSFTDYVYGTDPYTAFAFKLDEDMLMNGLLRYRIVAERGKKVGDAFVVNGTSFYYPPDGSFVELGVQANASELFTPAGGRFVLADGNPNDGETALDIPAGLLQGQTQITIDELPLDSPIIPPGLTNPIRVYRLESSPPVRGGMQLSLLYPDFVYPQGQDGQVDGFNVPENRLSIAWWDGFKWRQIGGTSNVNTNVVSAKIGFFNFMAIIPASQIAAVDRRPPQKIITPNGDFQNDTADFTLPDSLKVDIFDINGHRVRSVTSDGGASWDGRDDNGNIVESGVYIYQFNVDGERVTGLIAVAK